jgi:hypothetical protein
VCSKATLTKHMGSRGGGGVKGANPHSVYTAHNLGSSELQVMIR